MRFLYLLLLVLGAVSADAQTTITGVITDAQSSEPIELATVYIQGSTQSADTDATGRYELVSDATGAQVLIVSRLGYIEQQISVDLSGSKLTLDIQLTQTESDLEITVKDKRTEEFEMVTENTQAIKLIPSTTGNLESALPHIALGARSGTGGELSSQYNVRGGNYDENLVYVNGFEVFRPQLIRAGQQEGLSFPNIDLMRDLSFSSGGFDSKYGDKMSSVLDINYKRPDELKGSVTGSLLGGSAHIEGSSKVGSADHQKLRYLVGARYKTTRYLLGSLDVTGEYAPNFTDIQSYITYDMHPDWQLGVLANYNVSEFNFTPKERTTGLGLINQSLRLTSVFEGGESDLFKTGMLGTSLTYLPDRERNPFFIKILASSYRGVESENIDIIGYYRLSQVESDINSDDVGQEVAVLGVGVEHDHSRNRLFSRISNAQIKGGIELQNEDDEGKTHFIQAGVKLQHEYFDDRLIEWKRIDSAGYSTPYSPEEVRLSSVIRADNVLDTYKATAYVQDTYKNRVEGDKEVSITFGSRLSYWSLGDQLTVSPRAQLLYTPLDKDNGLSYKLAGGVYYQTPLYRELRQLDGVLNKNLKPQRSIHIVGGMTKNFRIKRLSDKPFKFILETYYKSLSDLVSYDVDNVRLRYSGENDASGYAIGLDFRVNGEFVPGAESWLNFSLLRTRESLDGVRHQQYNKSGQLVTVSDVPRPSDQGFSMSVYFQDYFPNNENMKVFLNLTAAGGLPFGLPEKNREIRNGYRFRLYRRVDMGFGFQLWKSEWRNRKPRHVLRSFENAWLNLEVFNIMGIANVSSNTWIRTIFQQQYAIPDNLTSRRVNLRFRLDF